MLAHRALKTATTSVSAMRVAPMAKKQIFAKQVEIPNYSIKKFATAASSTSTSSAPVINNLLGEFPPELNKNVMKIEEVDISVENIGKMTTFSSETAKKYLPEPIQSRLSNQMREFGPQGYGYLIRPQTITMINQLQKARENAFFNFQNFFLDGREGAGKSALLHQVVVWARKNDWLVVFIEDGYRFVGGGYVIHSTREANTFDQPLVGQTICKSTHAAHQDKLSKIPLKFPFTIEGFQRTEKSTLADLLKFGAENAVEACNVVHYFRRELSVLTEHPVLIVVDGVNWMFGDSPTLADPENKRLRPLPLPCDKLTLTKAFNAPLAHGLAYGTYIGATSYFPFAPKNNTSFFMKGRTVDIPKYSNEEFQTVMNYYEASGYVTSTVGSRSRDLIYYISEGLGGTVAKFCKTL